MKRRLALGSALVGIGLGAHQLATAAPAGADLPVPNVITTVSEGFGGWAWDKVASGIATWILGAVGALVSGAVDFLTTSARPDVTAPWFSGAGSPFASVRTLSVGLVVGFAFLGILSGVMRGDGAGMVARVAIGLPLTALAMATAIPVVAVLLELTDALSSAVLDPATAPGVAFLRGFGVAAASATGGFAVVAVGLVAVVAALALWAELLVRSALVYLLVALSPVVFAATLWPAARGALRRLVEVLLAVIVSKFVVCVAIAVGVAALGGAGDAPPIGAGTLDATAINIGTLMVGTAVLGIAAFSPFLVLRLLPVVEAAVMAQGTSRAPLRAVQVGLGAAMTAASVSRIAGAAGAAGPTQAAAGGASTRLSGSASGPAPPRAAPTATPTASAGEGSRDTGGRS